MKLKVKINMGVSRNPTGGGNQVTVNLTKLGGVELLYNNLVW